MVIKMYIKTIVIILIMLISFPGYSVEKEEERESTLRNEPELTIAEVVKAPDSFDGNRILVEGKVTDIRNVRDYTAFRIQDSDENTVGVYMKGDIEGIERGTIVRVFGKFSEQKSYLFLSFNNVIKADKVLVIDKVATSRLGIPALK